MEKEKGKDIEEGKKKKGENKKRRKRKKKGIKIYLGGYKTCYL